MLDPRYLKNGTPSAQECASCVRGVHSRKTKHCMDAENLTTTDLRNVLLLLDVCSQRGAFKGQELSQVGAIYDRLSAVLPDATEGDKASATAKATSPNVEM